MESSLKEVINAAIDNNTIGCALYKKEKRLESRIAFRAAASILHHLLDSLLLPPYQPDFEAMIISAREAALETTRWMEEITSTWHHILDDVQTLLQTPTEDGTDSVLFVNDVIKIPNCTSELSTPIHLIINKVTAAVVLNLAQTYLGGNDPNIIHAMALFESSYNLVMKEPLTCFLSEKIALVALNNATLLRREYGDFELAKQYVETMIQVLRSLPVSSESSQKEFRRHFLLNAFLMNTPTIIAARAA